MHQRDPNWNDPAEGLDDLTDDELSFEIGMCEDIAQNADMRRCTRHKAERRLKWARKEQADRRARYDRERERDDVIDEGCEFDPMADDFAEAT